MFLRRGSNADDNVNGGVGANSAAVDNKHDACAKVATRSGPSTFFTPILLFFRSDCFQCSTGKTCTTSISTSGHRQHHCVMIKGQATLYGKRKTRQSYRHLEKGNNESQLNLICSFLTFWVTKEFIFHFTVEMTKKLTFMQHFPARRTSRGFSYYSTAAWLVMN